MKYFYEMKNIRKHFDHRSDVPLETCYSDIEIITLHVFLFHETIEQKNIVTKYALIISYGQLSGQFLFDFDKISKDGQYKFDKVRNIFMCILFAHYSEFSKQLFGQIDINQNVKSVTYMIY